MRKLTILVMTLGLLIWTGMTAQAATSGAVAVTYTIGLTLNMTVEPSSWAIDSGGTGETKITFVNSSAGFFTVTNSANGPEYMDIAAVVTTGGCTLSTDASAGADKYRLGHGHAGGTGPSSYTAPASYTVITGTDGDLATIAAAGTYQFDLQLLTPTSTTKAGVAQTITVTITAKTA
jgi:hypothetical protein